MNARTFFTELKRRRVYSVAVAYVVVAWLLIQVATQVFPFFDIPNWVVRLVVLLTTVGFPIAVVCSWAFEMTPEGIKLEGDVDRRITRKTGRKLTALIVIVAAVAAGVTVFRFQHSQQAIEAAKQPPLAVAIESKSIAVLPFANLSDDKANAYFVSGMRDEILTSLAQLRDLNVRSRTSTQKYQSHPEDLGALSRELGVASVLEGSVQKAGDDVLINVQLIDTRSRHQLWAQSYRHNVQDIFGVQGEVAQKVADALKIKLAPAQEQRLLVPSHDERARARSFPAGPRFGGTCG